MQLPVRLYGRNRCDSKPIATTVRDAACFSSNPNGGRVFAADEVAAIARRDISKDMITHITARASKTQALRLLCSSPINDQRLKAFGTERQFHRNAQAAISEAASAHGSAAISPIGGPSSVYN